MTEEAELPTEAPAEEETPEKLLFDEEPLESFELHPRIMSALKKKGIDKFTTIQANSIKPIMNGADVLMRADTGSGKTLAYLLPIFHRLCTDFTKDNPITRDMGCLAIIISPTRELCIQIDSVIQDLRSQMPFITSGTLLGGEKVKSEKKRISKGINVLVATPGRLIYHMKNSINLHYENLRFLVLDEADRLLDPEALPKVEEIIKDLPKRQTVLVSATLPSQLARLTQLSLTDPINVGEMKDEEYSIPPTLLQRFVVVPTKQRLTALSVLLKRYCVMISDTKAIVFLNCCASVEFHFALFAHLDYLTPAERRYRGLPQHGDKNYEKRMKEIEEEAVNKALESEQTEKGAAPIRDIHASTDNDEVGGYSPFLHCPIFRIHGNVPQVERSKVMAKFHEAKQAVLFCTDVLARGLDVPDVTTIIQYDPPVDTEDYVHRVGRTARIGRDGISYLFLSEREAGFVDLLRGRTVAIQEYPLDEVYSKGIEAMNTFDRPVKGRKEEDPGYILGGMNREIRETVTNAHLESMAGNAWAKSIAAYTSHHRETRHIFNKNNLHIGHLAEAFGLQKTPEAISEMLREERELVIRTRKAEEGLERKKMLPAFEERTSEFL